MVVTLWRNTGAKPVEESVWPGRLHDYTAKRTRFLQIQNECNWSTKWPAVFHFPSVIRQRRKREKGTTSHEETRNRIAATLRFTQVSTRFPRLTRISIYFSFQCTTTRFLHICRSNLDNNSSSGELLFLYIYIYIKRNGLYLEKSRNLDERNK